MHEIELEWARASLVLLKALVIKTPPEQRIVYVYLIEQLLHMLDEEEPVGG